MRKLIVDKDEKLDDKNRLILRLWKVKKCNDFPDGVEFAFQYLYFKDKRWNQVVRIDNQLHEGKSGTHIHVMKREKVEWIQLTPADAEREIICRAERIIKNILDKI